MAWSAKITKVDVFYGAVNITIQVSQDSPAVSFTTTMGFNRAEDITVANVVPVIKAEIARVAALYVAGQNLQSQVNVVINP